MLIGLLQSCKDEIEMLENQSRTEVSAGSEQIRLGAFEKNKEYSPLFIDLVDDFNQKATYNDSKYPNDQLFGYTMSTLNKILKKSYGLSSLKSNLKSGSKPLGVTNAKIDLLFKKYEEIW